MSVSDVEQEIQTLTISREIEIAAPIEIAFEAMLEEIGPGGEMPGGKPFPMVIEPWPGGRWYRDLGDNAGHLWGHVQVIKPPTLLELHGPMFMSFPGINHVQYRLNGEELRPIFDWVKDYERMWNDRFDELDVVLEELKRKEGEDGSDE